LGALSWARQVLADTGEVAPIPVKVEDGPDGCFIVAGVNGGAARVAVQRRPNTAPHPILKEIHSCDVAGRHLEAESADALRGKVARMLEGIAPGKSLPIAYFRAPEAHYELPVYEDEGGHIVAHAFGGPRSRARDLAAVRAHVLRHLTNAGYVASDDDLEVGLIDPADLSLIEPLAVFRSLHDAQLWIPWTDRADTRSPRIDALGLDAPAGGNDLLTLLGWARGELDGPAAEGLYASRVRPETWRSAEALAAPAGVTIAADLDGGEAMHLELPVLRTRDADLAVALDSGGIDAFVAPTPDALAAAVGLRLQQCGFLRSPERVRVL
jgi:hypothetical protein